MSSKKGPDPGSGKISSRIRIPDPGGKKAPDPGSGSATLVATLQFSTFLEFMHYLTKIPNLRKEA
jgi:hypothetical protein